MFADEAGAANGEVSDDSFTTDDEETAAIGGNQMWTMSFEWQDGNTDASASLKDFEQSTDFGQPSLLSPHQPSSLITTDSDAEPAQPSPADSEHDWVQPWSGSHSCAGATLGKDPFYSIPSQQSAESQLKPKSEPMSDEHKTAILGETIWQVPDEVVIVHLF